MDFNVEITGVKKNIDGFNFMNVVRDMYKTGIDPVTNQASYDFGSVLRDFKDVVSSYQRQYEKDFNDFIRENSMLEKMKNSLNPTENRSDKIGIKDSDIQNFNESTKRFAETMHYGHSLLLKMREILTGTKINTKFIVAWNGEYYQVDEEKISPELILTTYGGNTVSNPFSLAYSLSVENESLMNQLNEQNKITDKIFNGINLFEEIWNCKLEYLSQLEQQNNRKYYAYWNSKDSEIYELLKQEIESNMFVSLTTDRYIALRKGMGGGGGYATPFYKAGDIGDTQIKFVSLQNVNKMASVNFARFSLLRDRFVELNKILSNGAKNEILNGLKAFFTEKESLITEPINKIYNQRMKEEIDKWFSI